MQLHEQKIRSAHDGPDTQGTLAFEALVSRIDARRVLGVRHGACKVTNQNCLVKGWIAAEIEPLELVQKAKHLV